MKFIVGFYGRGDLSRSSLLAECVVEALDLTKAKAAAIAQLAPDHPQVVACRYWHAGGYEAPRLGARH